jgi:hypothetical protein
MNANTEIQKVNVAISPIDLMKLKIKAFTDSNESTQIIILDDKQNYYSTEEHPVKRMLTNEEKQVMHNWLNTSLPTIIRLMKRMYSKPSDKLIELLTKPIMRLISIVNVQTPEMIELLKSCPTIHKNIIDMITQWLSDWIGKDELLSDGMYYYIDKAFTGVDELSESNIDKIMYYHAALLEFINFAGELNYIFDADGVIVVQSYTPGKPFSLYNLDNQEAIDFYNGLEFVMFNSNDDPNFYWGMFSDWNNWAEEDNCDMSKLDSRFDNFIPYFHARILLGFMLHFNKYIQSNAFDNKAFEEQKKIWFVPVPTDRLVYKLKSIKHYIPLILERIGTCWGCDVAYAKERSNEESKERSKEESKERSKEESKEESKERSKEESKEPSKEPSKEESKERSKEYDRILTLHFNPEDQAATIIANTDMYVLLWRKFYELERGYTELVAHN